MSPQCGSRMPLGLRPRPPTMSPPTLRTSPRLSPVPPSAHTMSPSQRKSVAASIRRTSFSSVTERTSLWSGVPLPPVSATRLRMGRLVSTTIFYPFLRLPQPSQRTAEHIFRYHDLAIRICRALQADAARQITIHIPGLCHRHSQALESLVFPDWILVTTEDTGTIA
jgi:hypothetical protein